VIERWPEGSEQYTLASLMIYLGAVLPIDTAHYQS